MSKPARGTKRVCPSCAARFYDLGRSPIVCPVCQSVYQVTAAPSRRAERAAPVEAKKPAVVVAEPPVQKRTEVISLEEAEESGAEIPLEEDEEIVDIVGDDDAEIPAAGDDDTTFLEEEEEGEADVKGIVGGATPEET
jgi:uncharacterized protein (TIGR02300 family)